MALNTTGSVGLSDEMKTTYDRVLLARALPVLLHSRFAQKKRIPKRGGKTIEFRKFASLPVQTDALVEGQLYTDLKDLSVTAIEATVTQHGDAVGLSDIVETTTIDPVLSETTELLGEQAGESIDEMVRDILITGTTVQYAANAAGRSAIAAANTLTVDEIREAVLTLKLNRARKIDGFYQAIVHPRTAHDIQGTDEWVTANNEHRTGRVFDGSLGTLYGVKFWESDKAQVWADAGNGGTVDVYASIFLGANAFGVVDLAGHNLRSIYKPLGSAGSADPLDQQQTMGWKCAFTTKILQEAFMLRVEHATSTGSNS